MTFKKRKEREKKFYIYNVSIATIFEDINVQQSARLRKKNSCPQTSFMLCFFSSKQKSKITDLSLGWVCLIYHFFMIPSIVL